MPLVMQEDRKKKIGWAIDRAIVDRLEQVVAEFGRPGLKQTCVEASLLLFFELTPDQRQEAVSQTVRAQMADRMDVVLKGEPIINDQPHAGLRVAAKRTTGPKYNKPIGKKKPTKDV